MFDRSTPVQASSAVSIRQLARSASRLIDRVERDGEIIALCRHGRMVAVLAPVPERLTVDFEGPEPRSVPEEEDVGFEDAELLDRLKGNLVAQAVLGRALSVHPMPFNTDELPHLISSILSTMTHLELADLVERTLRGNRLSSLGVAAARTLAPGLDRENPAPPS